MSIVSPKRLLYDETTIELNMNETIYIHPRSNWLKPCRINT